MATKLPTLDENTSEEDLALTPDESRMYRLKGQGLSIRAISLAMGYSAHTYVQRHLKRAMTKMTLMQDDIDEVRQLEIDRIDAVIVELNLILKDPTTDKKDKITAIGTILKAVAAQAKLMGLDRPIKIDVTRQVADIAKAQGYDVDDLMREVEMVAALAASNA